MTVHRALFALALAGSSAGAQLPTGVELMSPAAVAESLTVLKTLTAQLKSAPDNAAMQYRAGRIAFAILMRVNPRLPRMTARDSMPAIDRPTLQTTAADALSKASELDANNVEYLLTWASLLESGSGGQQRRDLADELYERVNAIVKADPDPSRRGALALRQGDGAWFEYNYFRLDKAPMQGFKDDVPDKPNMQRPVEPKREPGSSPENTRPLPSGSGGSMTASQAADAAAREASAAELRPDIAKIGGGAIPILTIGPRNVTTELAADYIEVGAPLPKVLAVATRRALERLSRKNEPDILAERHYLRARTSFDSAYRLLPTEPRSWRAVSMTRIEVEEWMQVQQVAEDRVKRAPDDAWGWFALGLARQRRHATADARAAFDTGLARMSVTERNSLTNMARLLRPSDAPMYTRFDSAARNRYDAAAWMLADPLWSEEDGDPRVEFYARIAHAEMMWGKLAPRVYGADTPDGQRFVRYGPPIKRLNNILLYPGGLIFSEGGERLKGFAAADAGLVRRINEWQPARWDNIAQIDIDSMPVQAARFRINDDSVDFFFATRAPIEKLDSVATTNTESFAKFWIYGWNTPDVVKDSLKLTRSGTMQWTRRLPLGMYNYRVEAIMPGTLAAGRAASNIVLGADTGTGFAMRGFGMSDLLAASHAEMPTGARRWSDVNFVPLTGPIAKGGQVSLVWENYEIGRRGNDAEYHVSMTLVTEELFAGKMSMNILAGITSAIKRQSKSNRTILDFDRIVPFASTIVDNLTLSFGETQPGSYALTVAVTDKVSGRTTSRTTRIVIVN